MNKVVLKEFKKEHLSIRLVFYGLFSLVGFELLHFSDLGISNPIRFVPMIFYCFAFLSILTYFVNRIDGHYELLIFGLINILCGTFVLVNNYHPDAGFILSDAVLLYSILNVFNCGYTCVQLLKEKKLSFFMKTSVTILLLFLGVFVISALYDKIEYGLLILGYYFTAFGLLNLLEVCTNVVFGDRKLQKRILNYIPFEEDKKEEEKEVQKKKRGRKPSIKSDTKVVKNRTIKKIKRK